MMFARGPSSGVWKKATEAAQASIRREQRQNKSPNSTAASHRRCLSAENGARTLKTNGSAVRSSTAAETKQKRELDRAFLISVLESSPTRRDAKAYLQTYGGSSKQLSPKHEGIIAVNDSPRFIQGPAKQVVEDVSEAPHIALVTLRDPQSWDDDLVDGVAKTLTQLRDLGLLSVIALDCGSASKEVVVQQTDRVIRAVGKHGSPGAQVVDSGIRIAEAASRGLPSVTSNHVQVGFQEAFTSSLRNGYLVVVPARALSDETLKTTPVDSDKVVLALAAFFSGLQFNSKPELDEVSSNAPPEALRRALVDRIIVIDPHGGIPSTSQGDGARVFVNLEEEFTRLQDGLDTDTADVSPSHSKNLKLVKSALAILPSSASAVITSPAEAANLRLQRDDSVVSSTGRVTGQVGTRRWQNPLIHNLLTDRPIYSSSLPIGRIKSAAHRAEATSSRMPTTTLAKKGLPVTIFPDPRASPWTPPKPGTPRLRLTDTCIDLPRLVHLINDSFSRQLDVEHYLRRLEDSLAGIIIAGEYEGGAILTWERPFGLPEEKAYNQDRLIPYLDKFAVLKKSQGAGGVADIVFNAMVRDCFPAGVCWRSRRNNPVNKWYFERSAGAWKLPESNWAMFWTDPDALRNDRLMSDYEDVCRNVVPSWADGKQAD
ncbi:mitochondrial amino-acid acetyltransferase [Podospora aff. communis PSN243]|uniref:Amino-acid acetyltransferase, mitochondrial n=1 Tax=Podospora aff. communis PSN243 TaxID=3040156 RepID=A0AAV9H113_9PEZI|nr:mitochondrial amino-acid acetyltransferase [Podospora aff. communis PSN243]